eukprot:CAMPEP_0185782012 /NCGR_PEP_ID=MMETSP1174-20130828/105821_1 /TAXON_ID=35687 /ORGANISM="Dictyocha speculum, Strain CCMP1381" /LENGTH=453 /DNA_ID=CAMNT_0028472273 /DNA_START=161 /DNA_END=1522 /DNA_ORIENTATION=+
MAVSDLESTPNPHSFILRSDTQFVIPGVKGLKGTTFRSTVGLPEELANVISVEGVDSIFAMEELVTINKCPAAEWVTVLPPVLAALGGATEALLNDKKLMNTMLPSTQSPDASASVTPLISGVTIRMQSSQGMPIQVEAVGAAGLTPPQRLKMPQRFGDAMALLIGNSGDAFFLGRAWVDRGVRYFEEEEEEGGESVSSSAEEMEQRMVTAVLAAEVAEVDAAYPADRLAAIIASASGRGDDVSDDVRQETRVPLALSAEAVDELIHDDEKALAGKDEEKALAALTALAAVVSDCGRSSDTVQPSVRRTAVAYLGGTGGRGGDACFEACAAAFCSERAAGLRRTAGDALSDLGDDRAVSFALDALADRSKLVRWRAARILGELGGVGGSSSPTGASVVAALGQAQRTEPAFEVAFEIGDAAQRVSQRAEDAVNPTRGAGPMWKQIQEGGGSSA